MPAAAAAALLDWQPVLVLEKENYALREENRHLHFQVRELMAWKERALKQMLALGPKRQRATRDVQHATQLQRKLQDVERSLLERSALDASNQQLLATQRALEQRVTELERDAATLRQQLTTANDREARTRTHVQTLADQFRGHLEQLVAIRERIDGSSSGAADAEDVTAGAHGIDEAMATDPVAVVSSESRCEDDHVIEDATVLITGLAAVSTTCLRWLHQHVVASFTTLQDKAARYDAQHTELLQLRARVHAIRQDVDVGVAKETEQTHALRQLQHERAALQHELATLRVVHTHAARGHAAATGDHVRLLVTEVRQYVRLVRAEIKRKFGYVPEAIAHADNWMRIRDALELLERQLRTAPTTTTTSMSA